MARIETEFVNALLERVDIVALINDHVPLKKAGAEYQALCPFHAEKTPSFTVSPKKQMYYCFGCEAGGNAIGFLMNHKRLGFTEAVEELSSRCGMTVRYASGVVQSPASHKASYELLERVARYFRDNLLDPGVGGVARAYLQRRGVDEPTAERFELGYAPAAWDRLLRRYSEPGHRTLLEQTRLIKVSEEDDSARDAFRNRLMFPIRDVRGRVVGFGGRAIAADDKPKYLNSAESEVFHKKRQIYALYQAVQDRKLSALYVVEGYMDVVSLAQHGVRNAVATMGTAVTREQFESLFRVCDTLILCFDSDAAGMKACERAMTQALPLLYDGREVLFRLLPEGSDPDSHIREQGYEDFVDTDACVSLSAYLLELLQRGLRLNQAEHKARLVERATPYLRDLPEGAFKNVLHEELRRLSGLDAASLYTKTRAPATGAVRTSKWRKAPCVPLSPLARAIRTVLCCPEVVFQVEDVEKRLLAIEAEGVTLLREMVDFVRQHPDCTPAQLLGHWQQSNVSERLRELLAMEADAPDTESGRMEAPADTLVWALDRLQRETDWERLRPLRQKRPSELTAEEKDLLLARFGRS